MRRLLAALCAIMIVGILGIQTCFARSTELLYVDFSKGAEDFRRLSSSGDSFAIKSVDVEHGNSLKITPSKTNNSLIGFYQAGGLERGRYHLEFEFYCDGINAEKSFWFLAEDAKGIHDQTNGMAHLQWWKDGTLGISRNVSNVPDPALYTTYQDQKWYCVSVWIDTEYSEILTEINGCRVYSGNLPETLGAVSGFAFRLDRNASDAVYLDNIRISRETETTSVLSPIKTNIETNAIGNNFSNDQKPVFSVSYTNRTDSRKTVQITYASEVKNGNRIWSENGGTISLEAGESIEREIAVSKPYYGRLDFLVVLSDGEEQWIKSAPYTMTNHSGDMPNHNRFGVVTHIGKGKGNADDLIPLMKQAGIGWIRDEMPSWPSVEQSAGVYTFPKYYDHFLELIKEYNLNYLSLFDHGNALYKEKEAGIFDPPKTEEALTALRKFIRELCIYSDGGVKAIEVWNEYHNATMSGIYAEDANVNANMHKAIYQGVADSNTEVKVVGIDEDYWNFPNTIANYLAAMNGEKCFDYVSIHPYAAKQTPPERGITGEFSSRLRDLLEQYHQDRNVPIWHTENGYPDIELENDREKQAAWTVRNQAVVQAEDSCEVWFNYNFMTYANYYRTASNEATFGIIESDDPAAAEVPYLGKEAYPALGYYNGLMADNDYIETIACPKSEDVRIYHFKDRFGRDILMLYTISDQEQTLSVQIGNRNAVLADMYGNERKLYAQDQCFDLTLSRNPQYLIADSMNYIQACAEHKQNPSLYAMVRGMSEPGADAVLLVLRNGYTMAELTPENAGEAIYYQNQGKADQNGEFFFAVPIAAAGEMTAYVQCGGEQRVFTVISGENRVVTYENKLGNACVTVVCPEDCEQEIIYAGYSETGALNGIKTVQSRETNSGMTAAFEYVNQTEQGRILFWNSLEEMKPIGQRIRINL